MKESDYAVKPNHALVQYQRSQYLNGQCTFSEYYGQFVNAGVIYLVETNFGIDRIKAAVKEDANLSNVPLREWDVVSEALRYNINVGYLLKCAGDYSTLAGRVCILKEAARQIAKQ